MMQHNAGKLAQRAVVLLAMTRVIPGAFADGQFIAQGGKLVGPGALGIANQGSSVALSGDGSTAIVGGPDDSSGAGAAWMFVRSGGTWVQQGRKLLASGALSGVIGSRLGTSVALSYDGNTAIVGAPGDDAGRGGAWVFTRTGTAWAQEGGKLLGAFAVDGFSGARQGESVALSWDGNTALVGAPLDSLGAGAVWVFTRSGGGWSGEGPKLVATTASGEALQGWAVALSGDGNTAIVGGIYDFNNAGAAWVFVRTGTTWTQQGYKLYGLDATGGANQGWAVALSYDGNTAIMGGSGDGSGTGAAWVFQRTNAVWSQTSGKLVGSGASAGAAQGTSVALSSDGTEALVGGPGDSAGMGAAWVFRLSSGTWSQQGGKITGSGQAGGDYGSGEGSAVALSADGNTALVGGSTDNNGAGAVWSFAGNGATWIPLGGKFLGADSRGNASQGTSVAISSDGSTSIAGGPTDSTGRGAAWVFTRSGTAWKAGEKLVADTGFSFQGRSVAISGDGTRVLVGAPGAGAGTGAAFVFIRNDSVWNPEGGTLRGSGSVDTALGAGEGTSAALSADGLTLIIGGPDDNGGRGAAWVFTRTGHAWLQQGNKLIGTGASGPSRQGASVALSSDGNTAIVGAPRDSSGAGASWVFVRSSGTWIQEGGKIRSEGGIGASGSGSAVALSGDGNTAIIGGPSDNSGAGAAWIFSRTGGRWMQAGGKITPSDGDPSSAFGTSVSLDADGGTAVIGGPSDGAGTGATWVFIRGDTAWTQEGGKLLAGNAAGNPLAGSAVALSGDGGTLITGGPDDNSGAGAAWVFVRTGSGIIAAGSLPRRVSLEGNYPNPFNPATTIRFTLPGRMEVRLEVFTLLGARIARLVNGPLDAGEHSVRFDASGFASGAYFARLDAGGRVLSEKLLLLR